MNTSDLSIFTVPDGTVCTIVIDNRICLSCGCSQWGKLPLLLKAYPFLRSDIDGLERRYFEYMEKEDIQWCDCNNPPKGIWLTSRNGDAILLEIQESVEIEDGRT